MVKKYIALKVINKISSIFFFLSLIIEKSTISHLYFIFMPRKWTVFRVEAYFWRRFEDFFHKGVLLV